MSDERSLTIGGRAVGLFGPVSSSVLLAWLASHRHRLRTVLLGGGRLSVLIIWDRKGYELVQRSSADEAAIYQLTYGSPMVAEPSPGQPHT